MRQDVSGWQTRLTDSVIAENTQSGIWRNRTLADLLDAQLARDPDQILIIQDDRQLSARDIDGQARALAGALQQRGLVAGDVISFQLPNWPEAVVVDMAAAMLGLVSNPIIPIYRDAEVAYILQDAGTKAFFITPEFRNFDYAAMVERHRAELPDLEHVVTVRGAAPGCVSFDDLLAVGRACDIDRRTLIDPHWKAYFTFALIAGGIGAVADPLDLELGVEAAADHVDRAQQVRETLERIELGLQGHQQGIGRDQAVQGQKAERRRAIDQHNVDVVLAFNKFAKQKLIHASISWRRCVELVQ